MGGFVQTCIAASNELASTNPHQMLRAETALDQWHCCGQAVKMTHNHGTQCKSVHLAADGMSCTLENTKKFDCELLHWAWEGVYRSVLQRVMSLHPQIHIRCCVQRQRLAQWHCCGQAVEMIHNHGTQCKSVHLAADGISCTLEKTKKN